MTTTIAPSSGAGALFTQQGVGSTPGYSALDDRRSNSGSIQEGVYGTSTLVTAGGVANTGQADFMVTQRAAGANMSVDINMPAGGFAFVQGDTINGQGLYTVPVHSANINEAIAAADATNPRVDQIILEIQDNVLDASGGNLARTRVLTGTPQPGATLTNRTGAVALPGSALLLADVLVGNGVASLANAVMRDRRKWARGAYLRIARTAADYTTASASLVAIDATNLNPRVECSGAPVRIALFGVGSNGTGTGQAVDFGCNLDGAAIDGTTTYLAQIVASTTAAYELAMNYTSVPSAGSHLIAPTWLTSSGTATLNATAVRPLVFTIEEIVRQNSANNTVTTG